MTLLLAALLAQEDQFVSYEGALRSLLSLREERGDWGPRPGDRGLALTAMLAGGWSELSKDVFDGVQIGDVLRRNLSALVALQRDDGLFHPEDPKANAWSALAVTEAYGLTGLKHWELPARRAAAAVLGMPAADEDALFWQILVRVSAHVGSLMNKGPEPSPLADPLRRAIVARWWGREVELPLPAELDAASAETLYVVDRAVLLGKGGGADHRAWARKVVAAWNRRPAPSDPRESAFRVMTLQPCNCHGCRSPFRKD